MDPSDAVVLAPAKINLVLEVGNRRPDGYHELVTVFQAVALHDRITVSDTDCHGALTVTGPQAGPMVREDFRRNLAWQAAALLADAVGLPSPVYISIWKSTSPSPQDWAGAVRMRPRCCDFWPGAGLLTMSGCCGVWPHSWGRMCLSSCMEERL